jgi:hypothetical protein
MKWFGRCAIEPNHFKSHDGAATPFPVKTWRWILFGLEHSAFAVRQKWSVFPIQTI